MRWLLAAGVVGTLLLLGRRVRLGEGRGAAELRLQEAAAELLKLGRQGALDVATGAGSIFDEAQNLTGGLVTGASQESVDRGLEH